MVLGKYLDKLLLLLLLEVKAKKTVSHFAFDGFDSNRLNVRRKTNNIFVVFLLFLPFFFLLSV